MDPEEAQILKSTDYAAFPSRFTKQIAAYLMKGNLVESACYMTKTCNIMEVYKSVNKTFFTWWANSVKDRLEELQWIFEFALRLSQISTKYLAELFILLSPKQDPNLTGAALSKALLELRLPKSASEFLLQEYPEAFSVVPQWSVTVCSFRKVIHLFVAAGVADRLAPLSVCRKHKSYKKTGRLLKRSVASFGYFATDLKLNELAAIILSRPAEEWPTPKRAKNEKKARYLLFCVLLVTSLKDVPLSLTLFESVVALSSNEDGGYYHPEFLRNLTKFNICESDKPQAEELLRLRGI